MSGPDSFDVQDALFAGLDAFGDDDESADDPFEASDSLKAALASPHLCLVTKAWYQGRAAYAGIVSSGVEVADFEMEPLAKGFFQFLHNYAQSYDGWPSTAVLLGDGGIAVTDEPAEPIDYWLDTVRTVNAQRYLTGTLAKAQHANAQANVDEVADIFAEAQKHLRSLNKAKLRARPIIDVRPDVKARYELLKSGVRGIPYPWPTLTNKLRGMWPEEFNVLVARTNIGKTWILLVIAIAAVRAGYRVLVATTELSQPMIGARQVAIDLKLDYDALQDGALSVDQEKKFYDYINEDLTPDSYPFFVIGGDFEFSFAVLEGAIDDCRPDLVLVDGMYLLKTSDNYRNRTDRAAAVSDALTDMTKRRQVCTFVTTQLNRDATKSKAQGGGAALQHIGLSDAIGWNAYNIFALEQTPEQADDGEATVKTIKKRNAGFVPELRIHFKLREGNFSEISAVGQPQGAGDIAYDPTADPTAPTFDDDDLAFMPSYDDSPVPF